MPRAGFVIGTGAPLMPKCTYTLSVIKIKKHLLLLLLLLLLFFFLTQSEVGLLL